MHGARLEARGHVIHSGESKGPSMANNPKSKLKILYVMRILQEKTDDEHGLTLQQIMNLLADYGIQAERKSLYRDFETLREFGIDIEKRRTSPVEYAIVHRDFSLPELMLLVDAVESCKFLTERQSSTLIANLKSFASDAQRDLLKRNIHVAGRITSKRESVFGDIDKLHDAMRRNCKVVFAYCRRGIDGKHHVTHDGKRHVVTPVGISYADGFYYLTAWSDERDEMTEFRIDRMERLGISEERGAKNEKISHYVNDGDGYELFGRFAGDPVTVTLRVDADKAEIIMDRFGNSVEWRAEDNGKARAVVKVHKSEQFFGWIAGLGGTVQIVDPELLKEYREYLEKLIEGIEP